MQTFLPYPDFAESASVLDRLRLGKQRVEVLQILNVLLGLSKGPGWANHPAVKMWAGYELALKSYGLAVVAEWEKRGYKSNMVFPEVPLGQFEYPGWLGSEELHASHRSNLLRKDPKWYGQFGWREPDDIPYFWPTKERA